MKEVISINIGGVVFSIEKPAYEKLQSYLLEIESHFKNDPNGTEIVEDIESSVAEKFAAKKKSINKAVTLKEVDEVIAQLGRVEDFDDREATEASPLEKTTSPRRLYRNKDEAIVGGVASGIAQYFGIDPVIVRVAFIVLTFWGGFGLLAYFILWVIVPKAQTASQKLAMKGESANLETIKNYMESKLKAIPTKTVFHKILALPVIIFMCALQFLYKIWPIFRVVLGGILLFISSVLIFVFSTLLMAFFVQPLNIEMDSVTNEILGGLVHNLSSFTPALVGLYVCFLIPTILVFLGGVGLVFNKRTIKAWLFGILVLGWLIALSFTTLNIMTRIPEMSNAAREMELVVKAKPDHEFYFRINGEDLWDEALEREERREIER